MKYAASPETIAADMEVPEWTLLFLPVPSAHQTSTPGSHSETNGACCECSHSLPSLEIAPTTMRSGNSAAKSAGYLLTTSEPSFVFYTGQLSLRKHGMIVVHRSGYPSIPG